MVQVASFYLYLLGYNIFLKMIQLSKKSHFFFVTVTRENSSYVCRQADAQPMNQIHFFWCPLEREFHALSFERNQKFVARFV